MASLIGEQPYGKHARIASIVFVAMYDEDDRIGHIETDQIVYLAVVLVENAFDPFGSSRWVVDNRKV